MLGVDRVMDCVGIFFHVRLQFLGRKLISFGENQQKGNFFRARPREDRLIFFANAAAGVDEEKEKAEGGAVVEVGVDRFSPFGDFLGGRFGKAVAREVDEEKRVVDEEEVEELRFAGCGRGAGEFFFVQEMVDEARFTDVGFADEGDFGEEFALGAFERGEFSESGEEELGFHWIVASRPSCV